VDPTRKLLIVEDNPGDVRLIVEMLHDSGTNMTVESVETQAAAIERLAVADVDVVLLDLGLPDSQGLETFTRLRDAALGVAIIVLTGNSNLELAIRAVKEGAQDFLVKDRVNADLLVRAITYAIERKHAEKERFEDLEEVANVDRLTGLHNRRGFDLVGEQAIAQAQRANQGIGLIFCDMDDLKTINDEFGHSQGDRALVDAASILRLTLRSADAMARIGGDEFVVLAIGDGSESLVHLNERLQQGFEFFNETNKRPYRLSMSSGTAWCQPGTPCRLEELRSAADSNMYAEKVRRSRGPHTLPAELKEPA